jgi:hypothetical protein
MAGGVVRGGNGPVGAKVGAVLGRVEATEGFGAGVEAAGTALGDIAGMDALGSGEAMVIGLVTGVSPGNRDRFSNGLELGVVSSRGSGETVSSGFTVALGFAGALGEGLGLGVDTGASSLGAGEELLWRNGVDAASCARTRAAVRRDTVARTNKRMMIMKVSLAKLPRTLARSRQHGQAE